MGIEGNALNLSLTGSQVSNRVVPNRSARKPPTVLAKTSSARSNSNVSYLLTSRAEERSPNKNLTDPFSLHSIWIH
jgi:hypothetical protein